MTNKWQNPIETGDEMTIATDILIEEGYTSTDELVQEWSLMVALTKVEQYQAECMYFQQKYQTSLADFEQRLHAVKGIEAFEKEEDLDDWEFAINSLKWWQARVQDMQNAINAQNIQ